MKLRTKKQKKVKVPRATIDFTGFRGWGHDITYRPEKGGQVIRGSMWCNRRLLVGDYLLLPNKDSTTRYELTEVRWCGDPEDMWHFTAKFAPRHE